MKPLVSSTDLVAYRNGRALFAPFTMNLYKGDVSVIRGSNGSGKSTLLSCFTRQYFDFSGSFDCCQMMSYLPQGLQHPRTICLADLAPLVVGYDVENYHRLLDVFDISLRLQTKLPTLLSGGQIQRIRMLLAMLRSHEVLLLDEPFANIDRASCEQISEELRQSRSTRATVLISHHIDGQDLTFQGAREFELRSQN